MSAGLAAHPLFARLLAQDGCTLLGPAELQGFLDAPGHALLFFAEDPVRYREVLDLAVVAPQLAAAFPGRFRTGVLLAPFSREVAPRYGFRRWPAFVLLRDGRYVGAIDGMRNWDEYREGLHGLLAAEPCDPPAWPAPPPVRH